MTDSINDKLTVLAGAAKYDVSCSSSGSVRENSGKGLGDTKAWGVCHSFTEDGRCISLLKVMLTNYCIYDCAYCVSRKSNDIKRASFTVKELVDLTIGFYRRNYIEGLFLSSGVMKSPDYTMERMVKVISELRRQQFYGYIHMKTIPGASQEQIRQAGLVADRLSVNIEIATEKNLKLLAPDKDHASVLSPMGIIHDSILENKEERKKYRNAPRFSPSGQSTQLVIGATDDTDKTILEVSSKLYTSQKLKRVYYSGYIPLNTNDSRLPALSEPPLVRENRLYQADWLFRFYEFTMDEIVNEKHPNLDLQFDPKLSYALRNPSIFPVDVNLADYHTILRVPGIGVKSAQLIVNARKYRKLNFDHLKKIGVVLKRAKYFIRCNELPYPTIQEIKPENLINILVHGPVPRKLTMGSQAVQLRLFE
ncbi:MAG: putative DNA modification/repair radical SAM protein [Bacteroidales bacterium]|nr:putative DNA modification/repair radical SAM protein [Bacteroidales bacterium]